MRAHGCDNWYQVDSLLLVEVSNPTACDNYLGIGEPLIGGVTTAEHLSKLVGVIAKANSHSARCNYHSATSLETTIQSFWVVSKSS